MSRVWRLSVGSLLVHAIEDGGMCRASDEMFPGSPPEIWAEWLEDGLLSVSFGEFLLTTTAGRHILIDTGPGPNGSSYPGGSKGSLGTALELIGVETDEIDLIIHTHLHLDHCGGDSTIDGEPAFANAAVICQQDEHDFWMTTDIAKSDVIRAAVAPVQAAGLWKTVSGTAEVSPGVYLYLAPGHTPGHQFVVADDGQDSIVFGGDAAHHRMQIEHPELAMFADLDPVKAERVRRELFQKPDLIALNHFVRPGRVDWEGSAPRFVEQPAETVG